MRHFPGFFDVQGRPVAVVGDTPAAVAKARLAAQCGALPSRVPDIDAGGGAGDPRPALAFVATGDAVADARAAAAFRARGVPVNVVDRPELSDFLVPAIVERGDVVIGISTGGAAPVLARQLRARIERVLPARLDALVAIAGRWRDAVRRRIAGHAERRRFWEGVLDGPVAGLVAAGMDAAAEQAIGDSLARSDGADRAPLGMVQIVGAGPGDPDLLTVKALRALQSADVILHDALVPEAILDLARRDAERVAVGRRKGREILAQADCHALMVRLARAGCRVVRLKGGDPNLFGRSGEEIAALGAAGVPVAVVPGITAALGCAAAIGMPLTRRGVASALTCVAGQRSADGVEPDWRALATRGQTLAIYMGLGAAAALQRRLLAAGLGRATPVAIVTRGTLPDQRVTFGSLAALPALAALHQGGEPTLLFVGEVVRSAAGFAAGLIAEAS